MADEPFQQALAALQAGNVEGAEQLLKAVLRVQPGHSAALNLLGAVLMRLGRFAEAETYLRLALQETRNSDATLYNYGLVLKALNRPTEALERFTQALAINSAAPETWNNRGTVFNDLKRHDEAVVDFDRAITLNPRYAEAFCNKGKSLAILGRWDEALAAYQQAAALKPDLAEAWCGRGAVFARLERYGDACGAYDRALAINRDFAEGWLGRGNALAKMRQYPEALAAYDSALSLKPDLAKGWLGRGNIHADRKQFADAFAAYDKALAISPDLAEGWLGRGNVFAELRDFDNAAAAYDRALSLNADLAEGWLGRGNVFAELKQYEDAFAAFNKALALRPNLAEAWLGRGNLYADFKVQDEALAAYDKALTLRPDFAAAWYSRGNKLILLKRYDEAYAAYDKAFSIDPELKQLEGSRLYAKQFLCDWTNWEDEVAHLLAAVRSRRLASPPFPLLAIASSAADQMQCARSLVADLPVFPPLCRDVYAHDRIRLAYLSSDFCEHPMAFLAAGLFEEHDKSCFELTAISYRVEEPESEMRRRLKGAFERFVDVSRLNDKQVAELIRDLEIDIAIDLNGMTDGRRLNVLSRRPAPVQATYLGYAGTMGADYIDYVIADATVIPRDQFEYFTEKVVWLPGSFMAQDAQRAIAERMPTRADCALSETGFVFCCFNNSFKISPEMFAVWMRLLKATDNSVLWLSGHGPAITANLRGEAAANGVAPHRLIFAPRIASMADHLARHRQADLFLDTLPYNAHATASDALWAGLPVLTCLGATFAGRVAASLNYAVGMDELVTSSLEEYEALAMALARDPTLLAAFKTKLARNRASCPLFDTKRFARNIEAAYATMLRRRQSGEEPRSFAVGTAN